MNIAEPAIMQSTDPDLKLHGRKQEANICLLFTLGLTATAILRLVQRPAADLPGRAVEESLEEKAAR